MMGRGVVVHSHARSATGSRPRCLAAANRRAAVPEKQLAHLGGGGEASPCLRGAGGGASLQHSKASC